MKSLKAIYLTVLFYLTKWVYQVRRSIVRALVRFKMKLQHQSLRAAIHDADQDKEKTGRKNMVVYNTASGQYEPIQKKLLKRAATAKEQPAAKNGWRVPKARKKTAITPEKVHRIEKRSLYVTG
jgi:hypothetical protein